MPIVKRQARFRPGRVSNETFVADERISFRTRSTKFSRDISWNRFRSSSSTRHRVVPGRVDGVFHDFRPFYPLVPGAVSGKICIIHGSIGAAEIARHPAPARQVLCPNSHSGFHVFFSFPPSRAPRRRVHTRDKTNFARQ